LCAFVNKQYDLVPAKGWVCSLTRKVNCQSDWR